MPIYPRYIETPEPGWIVVDEPLATPDYERTGHSLLVSEFLTKVHDVLMDRYDQYGHGTKEMTEIAQVWSGLLGIEVKPRMVPIMMAGLKLVRASNSEVEDHAIDLSGYSFWIDELSTTTR